MLNLFVSKHLLGQTNLISAMTKMNTDRIIGLSAMLISLLTLVIFIYQTNIMRNQSRLSVTPRFAFGTNVTVTDSMVTFSMSLKNKGLGPGIIESINIEHNGKKFKSNFEEFFESNFPEIYEFGDFTKSTILTVGGTLSAEEATELFEFEYPSKFTSQIMQLLELKEEDTFHNLPFTVEIVYSSIYEEQWQMSSKDKGHPIKL